MASSNTKTRERLEDEFQQLQLSLPKELGFGVPMHLYEGFWCPTMFLEAVFKFQNNFQPYDSDIILASLPKTGTTWLKSLIYIISNRENLSKNFSQHPFHTKNPHELILHFEYIYRKISSENSYDISQVPLPRFFGTHIPYQSLPNSMKTSKCRIVYVGRNPLDTFVSSWHFYHKFDLNKGVKPNMEMMENYVSKFCDGVFPFGSYEDHLLGYWNESVKNQQKVLFLEYEGLKKDPKTHLKKLAEFVNCPFSNEEEKSFVIDEIIDLCSLKSLKEMEVNKNGKFAVHFENNVLFRKGEVGDWTNHLTPSMAKRIEDHIQEKLKKVDFSFTYYQANI